MDRLGPRRGIVRLLPAGLLAQLARDLAHRWVVRIDFEGPAQGLLCFGGFADLGERESELGPDGGGIRGDPRQPTEQIGGLARLLTKKVQVGETLEEPGVVGLQTLGATVGLQRFVELTAVVVEGPT